ncbi:MAG: hypothetical protein QHH10_09300 [Peptococcaceae bacterium]|nr:hypothetical protein [Peptococcaceae bacterium]MDH7525493.1 hypothetical protein [Peptococcaceae bacterium]
MKQHEKVEAQVNRQVEWVRQEVLFGKICGKVWIILTNDSVYQGMDKITFAFFIEIAIRTNILASNHSKRLIP